jgi:hypothetical protein
MPTEFFDRDDEAAHDKFQAWRSDNEVGFFLNCKSATNWMLHRTMCPHHGDTDWGTDIGESLTRNKKICSTKKSELRQFARKAGVVAVDTCSDCKP